MKRPIFFFGTLMDTDVIQSVIRRKVIQKELKPALLSRRRKVATTFRPYPHLQKNTYRNTNGLLMRVDQNELYSLDWYEGSEYDRVIVPVRRGKDGNHVMAYAYQTCVPITAHNKDWSMGEWLRLSKPRRMSLGRIWRRV